MIIKSMKRKCEGILGFADGIREVDRMKKRTMAVLLAVALTAGVLGGCGGQNRKSDGEVWRESEADEPEAVPVEEPGTGTEQADGDPAEQNGGSAAKGQASSGENGKDGVFSPTFQGPFSAKNAAVSEDMGVTPCVAPYTIKPDLSNIDNLYQFYLDDDQRRSWHRTVLLYLVTPAGNFLRYTRSTGMNRKQTL